jgi:hypothetical protein
MNQSPRPKTSGATDAALCQAPPQHAAIRARTPPRRQPDPPAPTNLGDVRKQKQRQRARLARAVDWYMDQAEQVYLSVPMIYIYVTGSVTAAAALFEIERLSEVQFLERSDPWVHLDQQAWLDYTKLGEQEWLDAREDLRALDLIEERRRFDLERNQIVTEIQFLPDGFAKAKADVRDELREQVRQAITRGDRVPGDK